MRWAKKMSTAAAAATTAACLLFLLLLLVAVVLVPFPAGTDMDTKHNIYSTKTLSADCRQVSHAVHNTAHRGDTDEPR